MKTVGLRPTSQKLAWHLSAILVLLASTWILASGQQSYKVSVEAIASSIVEEAGAKTAKFVVQATNNDEAAIADLQVIFSPEFSVAVGSMAPGEKAVSGPQTVTVEVAGSTQSLALPVTYRFSVNGTVVNMPGLLLFRKAVQ